MYVESVRLLSNKFVFQIPRTCLKIFNPTARPDDEAPPRPPPKAADNDQQKPGQPRIRPRKPLIDEARFLEDIRKMKPKDPREPQTYYSHKMTLEAKELRPLLGAAALAEVTAAMERPARHFVGRPEPLITEDRGCVQPELSTYYRYRDYLGIVGPMPNIKPKVGPMTTIPAYLQALQQRNEMLGMPPGGAAPVQPHPMGRPVQQPRNVVPQPLPYQQAVQQQVYQPQQNFQMPLDPRQAFQRMHPHDAAKLYHEILQRQRRESWVDDLERSALMSPTPPLTECEYPLCGGGEHYHCVSSRRSADLTLSLTVPQLEPTAESPPCTRELTPPDLEVIDIPDGPVDHVDCPEYYAAMNRGSKGKRDGAKVEKAPEPHKEPKQEQEKEKAAATVAAPGPREIVLPKPPPGLSPKEAALFERCVRRLELIARGGRVAH